MTGGRPISAIMLAAIIALPSCSNEQKSQARENDAPGMAVNASEGAELAIRAAPPAETNRPASSQDDDPATPPPPPDDPAAVQAKTLEPVRPLANQATPIVNAGNAQAPADLAMANVSSSMATAPDLPASNDTGSVKPFPREVTEFMVRRDGCDHFRGEDAYDGDRAAYIASNIRALCSGTDRKLAELRTKYARNADVTAALSGYESRIEQPLTP